MAENVVNLKSPIKVINTSKADFSLSNSQVAKGEIAIYDFAGQKRVYGNVNGTDVVLLSESPRTFDISLVNALTTDSLTDDVKNAFKPSGVLDNPYVPKAGDLLANASNSYLGAFLSSKNGESNEVVLEYLNGDSVKRLTLNTSTWLITALTELPLGGGEAAYDPVVSDDLAMPNAVGGIAKGTTASQLAGKTFSEMFDDLLFPTVNPTFIAPSASISFKSGEISKVVEFNSSLASIAGSKANFNLGFNKGAININGQKQADRAGELIQDASTFISINGATEESEFPANAVLGDITYVYNAHHGAGPQPKDNKGNNYQSPLPEGVVKSSAATIKGVYNLYYGFSSQEPGAMNKKTEDVGQKTWVFEGYESTDVGCVCIPKIYKITSVQVLNTLSGQYVEKGRSYFDTEGTDVSVNYSGQEVTYTKYEFADKKTTGEQNIKITITK